MKVELQYVDPRLVVLYDLENKRGADTDFYLSLAAELGAGKIIDLGCGTGSLTRELATDGREVIGVDPAAAMLAYARQQPGAERVEWVEGDASVLGRAAADLVIMTGNVAQVFLEDEEWDAALRAIYGALRPGGYLAFESRNPDDRGWERWTPENTYAQFDSPNGPMESWLEVVRVANGWVYLQGHNVFQATGEVLVVDSELRFRTLAELTDSLNQAGFVVEQVYGDWQRGPVVSSSRVLVMVARRP
jgi:SAM-dependent methyltransferase